MDMRFRRYYPIIVALVTVFAFLSLVIGDQPVVAYTFGFVLGL